MLHRRKSSVGESNKRINTTRRSASPLRGVRYWRARYAQHVSWTRGFHFPVDERGTRLDVIGGLIASEENRDLAYAALELRQLIEYLVYRKLAAYSKYVPESVSQKWQPPQAMKALLRLEPDADKDVAIKVSFDATPETADTATWIDLGHHIALDSKWLTRTYSRLGSYVHVPHGRDGGHDYVAMRAALVEIFSELQRVSEANIVACSMGNRVSFACQDCGQSIFVNTDLLEEDCHTVCFNADCGARYVAAQPNGEWGFEKEAVEVDCPGCGAPMFLPIHRIAVGRVFVCRECEARTRVGLILGLPDPEAPD